VEVPYLTDWRRSVSGDLTSAFNFAAPVFTPPRLPVAAPWLVADHPECVTEEVSMTASPPPTRQQQPTQEPGTRPSPSGLRGRSRRVRG
jgi:phospholipase C